MALKGIFKRNNTNFEVIKAVLSHLRCPKLFKNFLDFPDVLDLCDAVHNHNTLRDINKLPELKFVRPFSCKLP